MKKFAMLAIAPILIAGLVAWWLSGDGVVTASSGLGSTNEKSPTAATEQNAASNLIAAVGANDAQTIADRLYEAEDDATEDPAKMFTADAAGNLVLKEHTRLNAEKILWLYSPEEQQAKIAAVESSLPSSAQGQFRDLLEQYKNLTAAVKQTYPPGTAPATVEDAIAQHEGLSALRKAHFGAEAAELMFGREERINRQLLNFMDLEKHAGLTMEEKTQKAQEMLSKSPELAAAYENNRNTKPN